MDGAALLLLPSDLEIDRICTLSTMLTVSITSLLPTSICPLCGAGATRIHSRYHRTVADVACGGRQMRLLLTVRKFFCDPPECARKIFTERLASFIEPWAHMTTRLAQALQSIGLATSGAAGTRLAQRLGIQTSPTTVLHASWRCLIRLPHPPTSWGLMSRRYAAGGGTAPFSSMGATIGSIHNFKSAAALKSYCGWTPKVTQSGKTLDHSRLTPGGNRVMKQMMLLDCRQHHQARE